MSKLQKIGIAADSLGTVTLPEHLIIDHILPRLPVKTLIRFKSVSKLWLSTISSPQFVRSHLDCSSSSSSTGQSLIVIKNKNKDNRISFKVMLISYDEHNNLKATIDLGFPLNFEPNMNKINIVGSSNGLVCLRIIMREEICTLVPRYIMFCRFYVCNPATRAYCQINNPDCRRDLGSCSWFGYIPSIDDYKIVSWFAVDNGNRNGQHLYVYSLRIGKWKIVNDIVGNFHFGDDVLLNSTAIVDDVLYCSPCSTGTSGRPKRIIGLDFVNERLKEAPFMDWLTKYDFAQFFVLNGCLSLLCVSFSHWQIRDVWALRKQGDWSSWEKSFSVHIGERNDIRAVTPTGRFLLTYDYNQIIVAGLNKDIQELCQEDDVYISEENIECAIGYVESLVSPFGTVEPNEEDDREV